MTSRPIANYELQFKRSAGKDLRAIPDIIDQRPLVIVVKIAHRKQAYRTT